MQQKKKTKKEKEEEEEGGGGGGDGDGRSGSQQGSVRKRSCHGGKNAQSKMADKKVGELIDTYVLFTSAFP